LFRAAASAPDDLTAEAPFELEARVIDAWRRGPQPEQAPGTLPVLRGAFVCACAIILVSAAVTFQALRESPPSELVIVDSAIQLTLLQ
jgi:hypothetical protein